MTCDKLVQLIKPKYRLVLQIKPLLMRLEVDKAVIPVCNDKGGSFIYYEVA